LSDPACWNADFVSSCIRECSELRNRDPLCNLQVAETAVALLERCPPDPALAARAHAVLGSALRVLGRLEEADAAQRSAGAELERLPAETRAEILTHEACLRRDQRRFDEALERIDRVCNFHRTHGREPDLHKLALALTIRCTINHGVGNTSEAVHDIGVALKHVDSSRSPESFAAAIHNLAWLLQESNHPKDLAAAASYVKSALRIGRFSRRSVPRAKLYWLQGLIGLRLGAARHAERNFRLASEIFAEQEMPYEVALVALDLASIYLEDARWSELGEIAEELAALVGARRVEGEIAAALALWQEAAATQSVTAQLHERARAALLARAGGTGRTVGAPRPAAVAQPQR
jgi:tetratricopeptide (TPR) repeat protein